MIARGDGTAQQFADALSGSYLAGSVGGGAPLLLTRQGSLPTETKTRLQALGVTTVHILGGTGAVSQAVQDELDDDFTVNRVQGTDRYDTAAKIAASQPAASIGQVGGKRTVFLATGLNAADALAAGPVSFSKKLPILLTQSNALPATTKSALTSLGITNVIILGGSSAVSQAVEDDVESTGATTSRVQGTDRYDTASKLADFALASLAPWSNTVVDLANGINPADALAGGPAAGRVSRSILLTTAGSLPTPTSAWLSKTSGTLTGGRVYGGTAAVSDSVVAAAEAAGKGTGTAAAGQVASVDAGNDRYTYVANGASTATTVTYAATDTFTVDGAAATLGGFEAALSRADGITVTTGATSKTHALTNAGAPTGGTVGNVDVSQNELDIVSPVTGDWLRQDITYASGSTFRIGGATATEAQFEANINEGDTIAITGTEFALTNADVVGSANAIEKPVLLGTTTRLKIGGLGDDPAAGAVDAADTTGQDDKYEASGAPGTTDTFTVDGATATYAQFNTALTTGDQVTYRRIGAGEVFVLVNQAPTTSTGTAAGTLNADGNPATANGSDGGSFTLATSVPLHGDHLRRRRHVRPRRQDGQRGRGRGRLHGR